MDLGADVVRIERPMGGMEISPKDQDQLLRGRCSIEADFKTEAGPDLVRAKASTLSINGFRSRWRGGSRCSTDATTRRRTTGSSSR